MMQCNIRYPSASTSVTVLSFSSQQISPAGVSCLRDKGGHHLHTVTNTGQGTLGKTETLHQSVSHKLS